MPPERNFSIAVGAVEADYSFSRSLSLSAILQVDTANAEAASANIRLRWNYRPDTDSVIYTAGQQFASLAAATPARFYQNRFVVKYTHSFRP